MDFQTFNTEVKLFNSQDELHQPERKRVLWEVYCGGARVSALAEAMGMDVEIFS